MGPKYKIGDLVVLNEFGRLVVDDNKFRAVLVITGPTNMFYSLDKVEDTVEKPFNYWAYAIMVGEELITDVPEQFLEKMIIIDDCGGE